MYNRKDLMRVTSPQKNFTTKGSIHNCGYVMSLNRLSMASKAYTSTIDASSTTKRDIPLSIGAQFDVGEMSQKLVSSSGIGYLNKL